MKVGILGDFCLSYVDSSIPDMDQIIETYRKSSILKELGKIDLNIVNLEAPITNSEKQIKKTGPNLKNPEKVIDIFKLTNVQICTLANNHIYDFGTDGLNDSIEICEKNNIKVVGAGLDHEKIVTPLIIEDNKIKIAIINFAENEFNSIDLAEKVAGSNSLNVIEIYNQINKAKLNSDFVIIISHGGHEEYHYPSPRIKKLYRFFVDIGVDAVIGHHPHVVQGYEEYKDKPIFYSIGNFFFPSTEKIRANHEGFVVVLEFLSNKLKYNILPYFQCLDDFSIDLMEGNDKLEFLEKLKSLSEKISNDNELKQEWYKLIQNRKEYFIDSLFPFNPKITKRLLKFGLYKLFVPKNHFLKMIDLIRCESHRDILISSLKNFLSKN